MSNMRVIRKDFTLTCPACGDECYVVVRRTIVLGYDFQFKLLVQEDGRYRLYPTEAERVDYHSNHHLLCSSCESPIPADVLRQQLQMVLTESERSGVGSNEPGDTGSVEVLDDRINRLQEAELRGYRIPEPITIE